MTTGGHAYPFRIPCTFRRKKGFIVLDQLRTVDRSRLVRKAGSVTAETMSRALEALTEMFAA